MKAIVFAVNRETDKFAVRTEEQQCAVFARIDGPKIYAGEVLDGDVLAKGVRKLRRKDDEVQVLGDSGPVPLEVATEMVKGSRK